MKRLGPTFVLVPIALSLPLALACESPPMVAVPPPTSALAHDMLRFQRFGEGAGWQSEIAAALQAAQAGDAPVLLRVRTTSGHGGATRKSAQIDDAAERLTFFAQHLGMAP